MPTASAATRSYRDVGSPEARARIWREAIEQAERDRDVLISRMRSRRRVERT